MRRVEEKRGGGVGCGNFLEYLLKWEFVLLYKCNKSRDMFWDFVLGVVGLGVGVVYNSFFSLSYGLLITFMLPTVSFHGVSAFQAKGGVGRKGLHRYPRSFIL